MDCLQTQLLLVGLLLTVTVSADQFCNKCDCFIRDNTEKGNINLKPNCQQGKITWSDPVSAIRLDLRPDTSGAFKACVQLKSENIKTVVSREISTENVNYRTKSRETEVNLLPWFSVEGQGKEYCVTSSEDSVMLYLEIESTTEDAGLSRTVIYYDMELVNSEHTNTNSMEECRPCTNEEMLKAYCINDFVMVGSMKDVIYHADIDKSQINVIVDQIIKTTDDDMFKRHSQELEGSVYASAQCGIQKGPGQFLFTSRTRLGRPVLTCAPFYDQWLKILERAKDQGTIQCAYG